MENNREKLYMGNFEEDIPDDYIVLDDETIRTIVSEMIKSYSDMFKELNKYDNNQIN
jgi:hypothetical protein